jgi:hypothetical protein
MGVAVRLLDSNGEHRQTEYISFGSLKLSAVLMGVVLVINLL